MHSGPTIACGESLAWRASPNSSSVLPTRASQHHTASRQVLSHEHVSRIANKDFRYTHVVAARPDTGFYSPVSPTQWLAELQATAGRPTIRVPNYKHFWGLNDRLAFGVLPHETGRSRDRRRPSQAQFATRRRALNDTLLHVAVSGGVEEQLSERLARASRVGLAFSANTASRHLEIGVEHGAAPLYAHGTMPGPPSSFPGPLARAPSPLA